MAPDSSETPQKPLNHTGCESASPLNSASARQTVLVIDDNEANTRLMAHVFQLRPHIDLIVAALGAVGLAMAVENRPDLILLDLNLPDMHGRQVMEALESHPQLKLTPVIIVSADATKAQSDFQAGSSAFGYVAKPFNLDEFLNVVDAGLRAVA